MHSSELRNTIVPLIFELEKMRIIEGGIMIGFIQTC